MHDIQLNDIEIYQHKHCSKYEDVTRNVFKVHTSITNHNDC